MTSNLSVGIGLRHPHHHQVMEENPSIDWFEVHSENFFHQGGLSLHTLLTIRQQYPISLHGVGLSLGTIDGICEQHLTRLQQLIELVEPCFVSEHLSWSRIANTYLPDLLPIPYNKQSFEIFYHNLNKTQDFLKREIFIENPSSYFEYKISSETETQFLVELAQKTGAKILLDINNVFVSCSNHGWDAITYLKNIPNNLVREIHLAGHSVKTIAEDKLLRIDSHDAIVCQEVWDLYAIAIKQFGKIPTLIEWDTNIPDFSILMNEAKKAGNIYANA